MNKKENKPIAPALKSLEKYKTICFPLSQVQSIRATINALKNQFIDDGLNFETKKNKETKMLEVTRIA
jgi:hypothetical protein